MGKKRNRALNHASSPRKRTFKYDVCLSFAGEDRKYVKQVAAKLAEGGVRVFYDEQEEVALWGKDLYEHLDYTYRKAARFSVLFVSKHYATKVWTNHERRSMQARALQENEEYILPVRFDSTTVPGLRETVGYVSAKNRSPRQLADLIVEKLGPRQPVDFLPPSPDRLFRRMKARTKTEKGEIVAQLESFHEAMTRMNPDERRVVIDFVWGSCPTEMPKNFHINLDLLRRETGFPIAKLRQILGNLSSLGFICRIKSEKGHNELLVQHVAYMEFIALKVEVEQDGPHNALVQAVFEETAEHLCGDCAHKALLAADFSQLASSTMETEKHRDRGAL
jgi:TIR domain